jgi:hypothetical protein
MSIAALVAGYRQRMANVPGPLQGATQPGVPILEQQFADLRLIVEIAFGADLTANSGSWVWTDVTTDVQVDGGKHIAMSIGRQDERSVAGPAQCQFTLDNRVNKYSSSPLGQNWPNVMRGVPVRVRTQLNGYSRLGDPLFQGYASSLVPSFDSTGAYAIVNLTANGILRRIGQGSAPLQSTMRIYTPTVASLLAYWPMEDGPTALSFASAGPAGVAPMGMLGSLQLHSNTTAIGSDALPVMNGAAYASIPPYASTGQVQVRMIVVWPAAAQALPDQTPLFRIFTAGTIGWWDVVYHTGGALSAEGHLASTGAKVFDTGTIGFAIDGAAGQIGLSLSQSGADISVSLGWYGQLATSAGGASGTATSQTLGSIASLLLLPNAVPTQVVLGHVSVQSVSTSIFENAQPVSAYSGEWAGDRLGRLLVLAGAEARGMITDSNAATTAMGPQGIDTAINLIREAEATAVAYIVDGLDASVVAWSHTGIENSGASMTLDATAGHLVPPFTLTDDDQLLANQWTLTDRNGSSVSFTDTNGPFGSKKVGLYQNSESVNVFLNNPAGARTGAFGLKALLDRAAWLVHQSTVDGYRLPTLELAFHHSPALLPTWLLTIQSVGMGRIDVTNLSSVYPQLPAGTLSLLAVGFSQVIDKFMWTTTINCVPYDPWRVGTVAANSSDTTEFVIRCDTSASTLVTGVDVGAPSLTIATPSGGDVWTTRADDVPFLASIGGIPVKVTAVTGSSSPQTFTVDPTTVTKGLPAGLSVNVWKQTVLAIGVTT